MLCSKRYLHKSWVIVGSAVIVNGREPVKAGLGGRFSRVVVWAEAELKVTHVVRSQLDSQLHMLFSLPCPVFFIWINSEEILLSGTLIDWPFLYFRVITPRP